MKDPDASRGLAQDLPWPLEKRGSFVHGDFRTGTNVELHGPKQGQWDFAQIQHEANTGVADSEQGNWGGEAGVSNKAVLIQVWRLAVVTEVECYIRQSHMSEAITLPPGCSTRSAATFCCPSKTPGHPAQSSARLWKRWKGTFSFICPRTKIVTEWQHLTYYT